MLKSILLPLDGSPLAERAVHYAAALARRSGATLELVQAVPTRTRLGAVATGGQTGITEAAEAYLDNVVGRESAAGIGFTTRVCDGDPVQVILDAAVQVHADLIVMSTHGRGGLSRMLYGSVADQVLRRASVPVLLVPSIVQHAWPAEGPLSLLVPLDGSVLSEAALASAQLLTEAFGSRLTLLRAVQPPPYPLYGDGYAYLPYDEEAELAEARTYLDSRAERLAQAGLQVETRIAVADPTWVIGDVARELNVDAVVMATHGAGGLSRLLIGSVATGTVGRTTAPLLLVRPSQSTLSEASGTCPAVPGIVRNSEEASDTEHQQEHDPTVSVHLHTSDLELIEHSLRALGFAPGYDYGHVVAARALADRLKSATDATTDATETVEARQGVPL